MLRYQGDLVLRKKAQPVVEFNQKELRSVIKEMRHTMHRYNGIGLAAPQIGLSIQLFVWELPNPFSPKLPNITGYMINPVITNTEGLKCETEGCLSIPHQSYQIDRPSSITLKGQYLNGNRFIVTGQGLLARCFAHETDHLRGTLVVDKVCNTD